MFKSQLKIKIKEKNNNKGIEETHYITLRSETRIVDKIRVFLYACIHRNTNPHSINMSQPEITHNRSTN